MIQAPLYQNPLAGGALSRPQENELQGDALVKSIQIQMQQQNIKSPAFNAYAKDVMETRGYPTKTMQEYRIEFPSTIGTALPLSEQTPMSGLPPSNNFVDDTRDKTLPQISDPAGLQKAIRTVNPIVSGPEEFAIASNQQIPDAGLFNRVGQQLIGYDDQFNGINDRLNKIEEGIASLMQNRGQGLNMNTGGLGYFFNPFGGFYG